MDLKDILSSDTLLILDNELKQLIDIPNYPMNDQQFFYVEYAYKKEPKPINKKTSFSGKNLILSKTELLKVDGKSILADEAQNFKLHYRNTQTKESTFICTFNPIFIETSDIKDDVEFIIENCKSMKKSNNEIFQTVSDYLVSNYGRPEKDNLAAWLEKEFGVK